MVKTKIVELEILYKTGVTRRSRSLPDDSLCPKYFPKKKNIILIQGVWEATREVREPIPEPKNPPKMDFSKKLIV